MTQYSFFFNEKIKKKIQKKNRKRHRKMQNMKNIEKTKPFENKKIEPCLHLSFCARSGLPLCPFWARLGLPLPPLLGWAWSSRKNDKKRKTVKNKKKKQKKKRK